MRLSELNEYSTRVAERPTRARVVSNEQIPMTVPHEALDHGRYAHGLAIRETGGRAQTQLRGLGELVQVVT